MQKNETSSITHPTQKETQGHCSRHLEDSTAESQTDSRGLAPEVSEKNNISNWVKDCFVHCGKECDSFLSLS